MDLVEIGHGAVRLGHVAELGDRRDVAVHRVDRFEGDELRELRIDEAELAVEVVGVVMAKMWRSARLERMPSIIEAWLPSSEKTTQPGSFEASVPSPAQFET